VFLGFIGVWFLSVKDTEYPWKDQNPIRYYPHSFDIIIPLTNPFVRLPDPGIRLNDAFVPFCGSTFDFYIAK